jgi:hypothetical protein
MARDTVMSSTIVAGFKLLRKVRCHMGWLWKRTAAARHHFIATDISY